ncbi:protein kinase domain-containing protein [Ditylenchus destructor]|uniref:Protein kinase domain-containing protein n=1 Tax=Ditylenchus destructor TaxID=166010 RepID=A0AAD4NH54_9BILA|nr:protein kinase domain-containing protein [Ditylenchus destructor]
MGCVGSRVDIEADGRQYHIKKLIASGGFSQIFSADDLESGEKVAIKKIVCHSSIELKRTRREISYHRRFGTKPEQHHVMPIIGVSEERVFGSSAILFSLVFPLCKMGSVQDELTSRRPAKKYMPQERILRLFHQVSLAVEVLHMASPPIAHRDLKPANLLFRDEDLILLTDFGSAIECPIRIENGRQSRIMLDEAAELCTMPYRAPELFTCETGTVVDQSVDIWSLGCVLYALCYFCSPYDFVHERGDSIALAVQSAKLKFEPDASFDTSVTDFISSLIKLDPNERPTISEVLQRMRSLKF